MCIRDSFTTPAGGCLISTAESGSLHFLSVVCGCETLQNDDGTETDQRFTETKRLFEYGFNHLNSVQDVYKRQVRLSVTSSVPSSAGT